MADFDEQIGDEEKVINEYWKIDGVYIIPIESKIISGKDI